MDHLGIPNTHGIPNPTLYVQITNTSHQQLQDSFFDVAEGNSDWNVQDGRLICGLQSYSDGFNIKNARNSFIQEWLFFGLISAVFHGIALDLTRFRHPSQRDRITTKPLTDLIQRWCNRERNEPEGRHRRLMRVHGILEHARSFARNFATNIRGPNGNSDRSWPIADDLSFSILVLGQTLSHAWHQIMTELDRVTGNWTSPEAREEGWGSSRLVVQMLEKLKWPQWKVETLQRFWKNDTIGLLLTMNFSEWRFYSNEVTSPYPFYHCDCPGPSGCSLLGNDCKIKVCNMLEAGSIPLFRYDSATQNLQVVPMDKTYNKPYVIFSHVWSDGFGNPTRNEMNHCLLKHFNKLFLAVQQKSTVLFEKNPPAEPELFWIDTLAIPVGNDIRTRKLRGLAIAQMHNVYEHAKYTIVLDKSLMQQQRSNTRTADDYIRMATLISMSGWTRRLWTLQESILSRDLYFNFSDGLFHIKMLEDPYRYPREEFCTSASQLAGIYQTLILEQERRSRRDPGQNINVGKLVRSLWTGVRWRETSQPRHETLALSIILNLGTEHLLEAYDSSFRGTPNELRTLMVRFINLLVRESLDAIPAGIIFLPGPHIDVRDYGWAPVSWLQPNGLEYTEPLTWSYPPTRLLSGHGLEVQLPGFHLHEFELHCGRLQDREAFHFPVGSDEQDLYRVQRADEGEWPTQTDLRQGQAAIICSRIKPFRKRQIGLLVSVKEYRGNGGAIKVTAFILCRVLVSRESDTTIINDLRRAVWESGDLYFGFGQALPPTQIWHVDRFQQLNMQQTAPLSVPVVASASVSASALAYIPAQMSAAPP